MATYFLRNQNFEVFLNHLQKKYSVYAPVKQGDHYHMARCESPDTGPDKTYDPGGVRAVDPLKAFIFKARQQVSENYTDVPASTHKKPLCIIGAKACDLKGLEILDAVFSGEDYEDPFYIAARDATVIISADCTYALEQCFCLALHVNPYPEGNFDINLSVVGSGYIAESGSDKGMEILNEYEDIFIPAPPNELAHKDTKRAEVFGMVQGNIDRVHTPDIDHLNGAIRRNYESPLWKEEAERCVECGACNTICPTCHCFLLFDQMDNENLARFRLWDSCLIKDFAKVAGGANPRNELWQRLRNRFEKKFDFFPEVNGLYACTGCGRCIAACPAEIDIRNVLTRNVEYADQR